MDSDGELRLTIMATLAQEASRKKRTTKMIVNKGKRSWGFHPQSGMYLLAENGQKNNGHTIQRDCVTVFISVVLPTLLSGKRTDALCFACSPCR